MIDISKLTEADKGRWVLYTSCVSESQERGRIKSWDLHTVWVVYHCDDDWDNYSEYTPGATHPAALEFIDREATNESA